MLIQVFLLKPLFLCKTSGGRKKKILMYSSAFLYFYFSAIFLQLLLFNLNRWKKIIFMLYSLLMFIKTLYINKACDMPLAFFEIFVLISLLLVNFEL